MALQQESTAGEKSSYYAVQEADGKIEAELEVHLLNAVRVVYWAKDYDTLKVAIIEVLEEARNFLYKYETPEDPIMQNIDSMVEETRMYKKSKEVMVEEYQAIRGEILAELGRLGFRRPKLETVPWDYKWIARNQLNLTNKLDNIIKKKNTGKKSKNSLNSSITPSVRPLPSVTPLS